MWILVGVNVASCEDVDHISHIHTHTHTRTHAHTCMNTGSSVEFPGMVSRKPSIASVVLDKLSPDTFTEHLIIT